MPITERQEKILNALVKEYVCNAEPVGSLDLKKVAGLDVSAATIRNEFQELTKAGYIQQPHASAGRIPTKKAYKHLAKKLESTAALYDVNEVNVVKMSIVRQVQFTHEEIEKQIRIMEEIMRTLEQDNLFEILNILDEWHKRLK